MATLANLIIRLSADTAALQKGINEVQSKTSGLGNTFKKVGTVAAGFLSAQVIGGGVQKLTGFLSDCTAKAKEQAAAEAQLGAVLKSTGGAAGVTVDEAKNLAAELQKLTNYGDEATIAAEALLLSFTNIGRDVFPDTTRAVLDMSTAMGQSLQTTAVQVGKALQDPVAGVTALQRVGVRLTEQQKEQVKAMVDVGNAADAQRLILAELTKEFGGSAEAAVAADGGMTQLSNRMGDLQEKIGSRLLPVMVKWKEIQLAILDFIVTRGGPVLRAFADEWLPRLRQGFDKVTEAANKIKDALSPIVDRLKPIGAMLSESGAASAAAAAVIGTGLVIALGAATVAAWSFAAAMLATGVPEIVAGIATLGAAIALLVTHWDDVTAAVGRARNWIMSLPMPLKVLAAMISLPVTALIALGVALNELVTHWRQAATSIANVVASIVKAIYTGFNAAIGVINDFIGGLNTVSGTIGGFLGKLPGGGKLKGLFEALELPQIPQLSADLSGLDDALKGLIPTTGESSSVSREMSEEISRLTGNVQSSATAIVKLGGSSDETGLSLEDMGDAAGGAAGGASKLAQEVKILTPEMAALNDQIVHEEAFLESVGAALDFADKQHETFTAGLEEAESALRSAEDAMHDWENAILKGTRAYSDMAFGISQESDALQLKINKINLGILTEGLEEGDYASKRLEAAVRTLARSLHVDLHSGKLDIEDINEVLDAAGKDMDILGLKSQNVRLQENLDLGPKRRELEQFFEDANGYAEYTLPEIEAGYLAAKTVADKATEAVGYWNDQLTINELHMSFIQGLLANHEDRLARIRDKYNEIEQAAREAWAAAVPPPTGTIVLPVPAPSYQHGGYVERTGLAYVHAGEAVVPAGGGGAGTIVINNNFNEPPLGDTRYVESMARRLVPYIREALRHGA
jgi:hypothetical protein